MTGVTSKKFCYAILSIILAKILVYVLTTQY